MEIINPKLKILKLIVKYCQHLYLMKFPIISLILESESKPVYSSTKSVAPAHTTSTPVSSSVTSSSSVPAPPISKPGGAPNRSGQRPVPVPAPLVEKSIEPAFEVPKDIMDLEKAVESAAVVAIKEYNRAVTILKTLVTEFSL